MTTDVDVDVVCLDESRVLFVPAQPSEPSRHGRLADVPSFHRSVGGAEPNVACALARAGHTARWISRVGTDGFGDHMAAAALTAPGGLGAPPRRALADALVALPDDDLGKTAAGTGLDGEGQEIHMSQTVDRALRILPLLAEGPANLEQVAARLDVHKSTALRLLRTLHEHGLVHRQDDQRYRLGARLFALAQEAMENLDIRGIAHPHLVALNENCGHTVHLAVHEEGEVVYIDKVESRYPVRMYSRIGKPVAITVAAVAKLLLADLSEQERRTVADRLDYPRYTARSTPDATAFLAELATVREQGWATDFGGHEESVNCVGAPVRGADGRVVAACSISAPNVVVTAEELLTLRPLLLRTAEAISRDYSGKPPLPPLPPREEAGS